MFLASLAYIEKALEVTYEMSQNGDPDDHPITTRVTGGRLYAVELDRLMSLIFRAAGKRGDEEVCFDQEISDLSDEMDAQHPKLRDLRNALFAHPPFVDDGLVPDDHVLLFTSFGVHIAPAEGGWSMGETNIADPFLSHMKVPDWIKRFRGMIEARQAAIEAVECPD